ncbi:MAG: hypothetical protein K0Q50_2065 [Vampirovibrio sp.]|nr:hypothetical protein [Vampirovibrio sp.]
MRSTPHPLNTRAILERLHSDTGKLLKIGNRLMAAVVSLGGIFCLMAFMGMQLAKQPEKTLHLQAFMFNYSEFAHIQEDTQTAPSDKSGTTVRKPNDPNWDGLMAGAGLGFNMGRNIPLIGVVVGPVIGAMIGYDMDSKI